MRQGLALSFVNAPFGVFVWTLAPGMQGGDETKRTRSPELWGVEAALLSRASDSITDELEHCLLETGRKARISGTKSPFQTFNLDVQLGILNISFPLRLSPRRVRLGWKLLWGALLTLLLLLMSITIAPRRPSTHQSCPAHRPHVVSAAHSRSTGYSYLVKDKKGWRRSGLFVLQKRDGAQREAITCPKSPRESQIELGTVM